MKKNVGAFDGVARMLLAFALIAYGILAGPWWIALLSVVPIVTAALFYCPIYDVAGMNTCDSSEASH